MASLVLLDNNLPKCDPDRYGKRGTRQLDSDGRLCGQHRWQKAKQAEIDQTVSCSHDTSLSGGNGSSSFEEYADVPEVAITALGRELGV